MLNTTISRGVQGLTAILHYFKKHKFISLIIVIAFFSQMAIVFPYGREKCIGKICGIFFADIYRAHDDLWHISIARTAFSTFPFRMPIFAGAPLIGFHYLYAFIVHLLNIISISPFFSYYTLMPILWFVLYTLLSITVARKINSSPKFVGSFLFFQYFAGSFSYILRLYHYKNIWYPSLNFANQPGELMINQHLAFSFVLILAVMLLIHKKIVTLRDAVMSGVVLFLAWGMKFYGAVTTFSLLFIYCLFSLVKKRINLRQFGLYIMIFVGSSLMAIFVFYNPFSSLHTGAIFKFSPFATSHFMIEEKNMFYLKDWVNARYYLYEHGFGPRLLTIELFSLFASIFFSFGTRVIGVLYIAIRVLKRTISEFEITLIISATFVALLSVLFIQKGDWFNTSQFMHCAMFIANLFAAHTLYIFLNNKKGVYLAIAVLIMILTVHNSIDYVLKYSSPQGSVYISRSELDALRVLNKQPDGTVFVLPFIEHDAKITSDFTPPFPLAQTVDAPYISAFTGKQTWFSDTLMLRGTGIDYSERQRKILNISSLDPKQINTGYFYLDKYNKSYLLFLKRINKYPFIRLFENDKVLVLKFT